MKKRLVILLAGLLTVLSMGFGLAQFSDVPAGHWAKEAVEALAAKGLVIGFPDGTFRGNETLTRYQAALIIYRLLQQIEAELKAKGESPTMKALSEEDLQALRNAVQELASELAALGVRVSALEDNAATKDDIARLKAALEELKAMKAGPAPSGMDEAALADLADRVEAASVAADTALAQAKVLAERLDAVEGDLATLKTQVEADADSIRALNELSVLLNQDVLTLQDRVTALEKQLGDADFGGFANREDLSAIQEFAAALRSDLVKLADRVGVLESKVADLSKVRYTISGSLSATYGTVIHFIGTNFFDLDRLFPQNPFSTGVSGAFTSNVQQADSNQGNISGGSGSLTFGVKVAEPGSQGVNVSEASATLGIPLFPGAPTPSLTGATVRGNVDGQAFSVVYSSSNSAFKFNDYLFANDNDPDGANPRRGVVATFQGTKFPLSPEVTVVTGTALSGADAPPALQPGSYFGIRTALRPFGSFTLALNYATNLLNRSAIGVDGGFEFGLEPLSLNLSYLWVSSQAPASPVANFFNNTLSDWAYYVQGQAKLGAFSLEGNYHAVDPDYADGKAGMSENEDTNYYGGVKSGAPYGANTRGLGFALSTGKLAGFFSLKGYAESEGDYVLTPGTVQDALGAAITLGSFRGFSLTGFVNRAATGGNRYFSFAPPSTLSDSALGYSYTNENQKYSSSFGATLVHDGKAQDALIPTLNLTLQYANFYKSGYHDFQVYGSLASPFKLAFLNLNPGFRYHLFSDPANTSASKNYTTVKAGLQASTDPLLFGLSLDGAISYRNTNFSTLGTTTYELYWRAGGTISDFLAPGVKLSGAYAHYEGDNLAGAAGLPTVGSGNQAFNFARDRVYRSPDPILGPWTATPGKQSGKVEGFYLQAEYYNLTVAYGEFAIGTLTSFSDYSRGFKFSYNVKF